MTTLTFKALSALLSYPSAALQQAVPELRAALKEEALLCAADRRRLEALLMEIADGDLYDLQERYVLLFDRTRSLSLHLFEHVHGESRDRGQAMIDLKQLYENSGLELHAAELPDFLPLFLEFLATRPRAEAYELLGQPAHILAALAQRLRKRRSTYEAVFGALVTLAATKPKGDDVAALLAEPDPDADDLAALDAAWEDEPVNFGPGAASCKDTLIEKIRAGRRPAPGVTPSGAAARPVIAVTDARERADGASQTRVNALMARQ
jgi:nitrate reductase molybdenum cofactor assembly chaperone NarJ/NarW